MKIAVDLRSLSSGGRSGGVEEYIWNILGNLLEIDNRNTYLLFKSGARSNNQLESVVPRVSPSKDIALKNFKFSNRLLNVSLKLFREPLLDSVCGKVDAFFMPNINLGPVSKKCKKIITFHDLSYEIYPEYFSLKRRLWHKFINPKQQAEEAYKIIAVSEATKNDLLQLYNVPPEKIKVIYSGVNSQFYPIGWNDVRLARIKKKYNLPDKFILYFGVIEPRKNISGLIKAFELARDAGLNDFKLVIAGSRGWLYEEIIQTARESRYAKDIVFTGFIDSEDKIFVYNSAHLFIYPSFYEGFGFPPLEAMACGIPTITSNVSSLPEVVDNAAVMIDPYKVDELAEAIQLCAINKELRVQLVDKGLKQARKFNWENAAKETLDWISY